MTHESFLRQLVLLDALPQSLLTFCMRESIKLSNEDRAAMVEKLQLHYAQFSLHQQQAKAAFILADTKQSTS